MENELWVLGATWLMMGALLIRREKQRKRRRFWVDPYLFERNKKGRFQTDFLDMSNNEKFFRENFHMDVATFEMIFQRIEGHISPKAYTRPKDNIPPRMRLAIVLEFLASGTISRHLSSIYRMSQASFCKIIDQVCNAIIFEFQNEYMDGTNEKWIDVANDFNYRWNFPNCLGAIDGKHVPIVCPKNSGSLFYNYKKFYSIVLMAISDANYKFTYVNVGAYGSEGDSGVFAADKIGRKIYNDELTLPAETTIRGHKLPYFFIADDAFRLSTRIMKPYSPVKGKPLSKEERIFNYRLSRARRCVENAFGILSRKWLCLSQPLRQSPARASKIVLSCCTLHNLLIGNKNYCPPGFADSYNLYGELIEGEWRKTSTEMVPLQSCSGRVPLRASEIRDLLKDFINSPAGSIPWQTQSIQ